MVESGNDDEHNACDAEKSEPSSPFISVVGDGPSAPASYTHLGTDRIARTPGPSTGMNTVLLLQLLLAATGISRATSLDDRERPELLLLARRLQQRDQASGARASNTGCEGLMGDVNIDGRVAADDLLHLLGNFGHIDDCQTEQSAQRAEDGAAAEQQYEERIASLSAQHEQQIALLDAQHEQQLHAFQCPPAPDVAHADVSGDYAYGGAGLRAVCHEGYMLDDFLPSMFGRAAATLQCTRTGTWTAHDQSNLTGVAAGADGAPLLPRCIPRDPCATDADAACPDPLASCSHTGLGTHSCHCESGAFGDGQTCEPCSSCGLGKTLIAHCTATTDTQCYVDVALEALPYIDGATLRYSNGLNFPTTGTYSCRGHSPQDISRAPALRVATMSGELSAENISMSRSLRPDGSWTPAGALECPPADRLGRRQTIIAAAGAISFAIKGTVAMEMERRRWRSFIPTTVRGFELFEGDASVRFRQPLQPCAQRHSDCRTFAADSKMEFMVRGVKVMEISDSGVSEAAQ